MTRESVLVYGRFQRVVCVAVGVVFLLIGIGELVSGRVGAQIFGGVLLAAALGFAARGSLVGLTVNGDGLTERTIERTRRISWNEIQDLSVTGSRGNAGEPRYDISVILQGGEAVRLRSSGRISPGRAKAVESRIRALAADRKRA